MNRTIETNPNRMLGATISADNRTYGLAPARPAGQPETVAEIADPYLLTVITTAGNRYSNGDFTVLRLLARRDGVEARLPTPTHSRFHVRDRARLDPGVLPWVSMEQALGWGMTERPSMSVTGGGTGAGGAEPFGSAARRGITREEQAGRWSTVRSAQSVDGGERAECGTDEPALTVTQTTSRARFLRGTQRSDGEHYRRREVESPAQTITGMGRSYAFESADAPAPTINGDPQVSPRRCKHPGPGCCSNYPGEPQRQHAKSRPIAVAEAAALQTFPADYRWCGTKTQQFQQVGSAVPPLLAYASLSTFVPEGE